MTRAGTHAAAVTVALVAALGGHASAQRGGGPGRGGPPPTPRASAPIDLTGYWVSSVTEDWRYRMVTPPKGDYQGVPMTPEAVKVADAWDPAADEAAGEPCRSYGAPAIVRVPGRLHVTWQDDRTLRVEADAGTQTRLFRFGQPAPVGGAASWQGESVAEWRTAGAARGRGPGGPAEPAPGNGSLKVVTRNLRPGYLRKNGVPYSASAVLTEYFSVTRRPSGDEWLVVVAVVEDPQYLRQPFVVSTHFRKQADAAGWDPTPCSATW